MLKRIILIFEAIDDGVEKGRDDIVEQGQFLVMLWEALAPGFMYVNMAGPQNVVTIVTSEAQVEKALSQP